MRIKHDKLLLFLIIKKGIDFLIILKKNDFKKLIIQSIERCAVGQNLKSREKRKIL